jgi:hypothetical protein
MRPEVDYLGAGGRLWRVDPARGRVVATLRVPPSDRAGFRADDGASGGDVAVARDAVWGSDPAAGAVWQIDPRRNRVTDGAAAAASGGLWLGTPPGLFHVSRSVLRQP